MNLVCQPFQGNLGEKLIECLQAPYTSFRFVVAYARASGTGQLGRYMDRFLQNGGAISGSIGIDQRNASQEALLTLLDITSELFVFHNERLDSTFHPKIYLFDNARQAVAFIGSNNLTAGGLYTNYEMAAYSEYDLTVATERAAYQALLDSVAPYFDVENPCCRAADKALIQRLYDSGYILTEPQLLAARAAAHDTQKSGKGAQLFGAKIYRAPAAGGRRWHAAPADVPGEAPQARGFWKKLSGNDVKLSSSPGQIIIPIRFKPFFEPFGNLRQTAAGAMQSERFFSLLFVSPGMDDVLVEHARVILYVPAPNHLRPNQELRFTFRNRKVFNCLQEGDILKFEPSSADEYSFVVTHIPADTEAAESYNKRYDIIME